MKYNIILSTDRPTIQDLLKADLVGIISPSGIEIIKNRFTGEHNILSYSDFFTIYGKFIMES